MVELPCFMSNLRRDARGINVSLNTRSIWPGEATTAFAAGVDCCSAAWACATCSENCPAAIARTSAKERMTLDRSEEHTSELQSLMRISYAVFCLKKKTHYMNYAAGPTHTLQSHNTTFHDT